MKRLDNKQLADWLNHNGFERDGPRVFPKHPVVAGLEGTLPIHSGALSALARKSIQLNRAAGDRLAIIVGEHGVWPTLEFDGLIPVILNAMGDDRAIQSAPAFLFDRSEENLAIDFWRICLISGWDAALALSQPSICYAVSHDQWFGAYAIERASLDTWARAASGINMLWNEVFWQGEICGDVNV